MRYASLAFRTLSLLDLVSSSGISVMSLADCETWVKPSDPVDNPSNISKPTTVSEHFLTNDHSANDITLIPLELIKSARKAREAGNLYEAENELLYWFSALFKLSALVGNGHYPSVQYQDLAVRSQG